MRATLSAADRQERRLWFFNSLSTKGEQTDAAPAATFLTSYTPSLAVFLVTLSTATFAWWTARRSADLVDTSGWVLIVGLALAGLVTLLVVCSDHRCTVLARQVEGAEAKSRDEKDRIEAALRDSTESHRLAVEASEGGSWDWNLRGNEIHLSARWQGLLGFSEGELSHRPLEWFQRVHPEDLPRLRADLLDFLRGRTSTFELEHRMRHHDGGYRWMLCRGIAVRDDKGRPQRLVGTHTDVTRYRESEKKLVRAAMHDLLTGLPNRTYFMEQLAIS